MRNDERLRTIYEVMAPYIVRNEHNWRDYLAFASQFHKHSFDNILLVYAQPDPIGDYNIPDEVDEMGGPHRQMTIGEADFDYVLDAVAYEAGETVVEPVKPQAIVQMENDTPAAGDEPASVPDENPPVVVEAPETARPTDTAEQPTPPPVKGNTTAHKNFRRFQELFPEIVSGQYEYLRLEAGEAYYPLVIHHKYGSHYCMEHYYI